MAISRPAGHKKNKANQTQFWGSGSLNIPGKADRLVPIKLSG
jgi:hypothetical protein